jgi:uncharacterized protein (DUF58 family)
MKPHSMTFTPPDALRRSATLRFLHGLWMERFSSGGRWLFIVSGLFFGYGATSLDLQVFVPLLYLCALWFVAFFVMLLERPRAQVNVQHAARTRAGASLPVEIEVTARRASAHDWRVLPHYLPDGLELAAPGGAILPSIKRGQSARVTLTLKAQKRGAYDLRGWRIATDFPFGLLTASRVWKSDSQLLVHPRWTPLQFLELPTGRRYQPGGVALAAARGESLEYIGNRDFREGDDVRFVDWRATARLQTPIVREYREEYFLRAAVILDTFAEENNDPENEHFERAVSLCAAISDFMAREDYLVDLFAAGPQIYHLTSGRSLAYLEQILDILACVETSQGAPFESLEPEIESLLSQITTIICVFLDWTPERRAFAERLALEGAAIKVFLARDTPPTLEWENERFEIVPVPRTWFESGVMQL